MARLTISQLSVELEHARSLCAQQEIRIRCDAQTIRTLKNQIDQMATTERPALEERMAAANALVDDSHLPRMTMANLSMRYCREKHIRVCTVDELRNYAQSHGIVIVRSF